MPLQSHGIVVAACLAALSLCSGIADAQGTHPAAANPTVTNSHSPDDLARLAASENLPQVSVAVLRSRIQTEQDPSTRLDLSRQLAALLVEAGRPEEALAFCASTAVSDDPELSYWKARALAGSGDPATAKAILSQLLDSPAPLKGVSRDDLILTSARVFRSAGDPIGAATILERIAPGSPRADDALLEKGASLLSLGKAGECLALLKEASLSNAESKAAAAYLLALATWKSGDPSAAARMFESVPPATPWIASASALGGASCLSLSGRNAKACSLLQHHLDAVDDAPLIDKEFRLLDALTEPDAQLPFTTWARDRTHPVRARYASFVEALRRQRADSRGGDTLLRSFLASYPEDALAAEARLLLALSSLRQGQEESAAGLAGDDPAATPSLRARLAYVRGLCAVTQGDRDKGAREFREAGERDPRLASSALFNRAVLAATSGKGRLDLSEQAAEIAAMEAGLPSEEMRFQIALDLARRGDPSGERRLAEVGEKSSDPAIKSRARLASAELAMASGHGEVAARDYGKVLHENAGEPEREEYLGIFLKETGRKSDTSTVVSAARAFLQAHPDSRFAPEVRLKLAEALLASGDAQGARVQFEQLASASAGSELGRRALFLAAQASARSMDPASIDDALVLLERVAAGGPNDTLTWQARLQEGAIKNAQDLPKDALAIYGKILSSPVSDSEIRAAALMAKGDTLHRLASEEPGLDREAASVWSQLAADHSQPLRWRNQALCKKGMILAKLGDGDAALAAFYEAFKNPREGDPEQLWHDKAAFEAAHLLEQRRQWNDAFALYRQITEEGGARADEAKARLSKLKLENFLWEN